MQNGLNAASLTERAAELDFPGSVIDYYMGHMGQPQGGFPEALQKAVLRDRKPLTARPGELLPPVDIAAEAGRLKEHLGHTPTNEQVMAYLMYPQVTLDLFDHRGQYGNLIAVSIEEGNTLIIKLLSIGDLQPDGKRTVFFELNGQPHEVEILDRAAPRSADARRKTSGDPKEVGAHMPGNVISVLVQPGDTVEKNSVLAVTEAMKVEMQIQSPIDGVVKEVQCKAGERVEPGDLLIKME